MNNWLLLIPYIYGFNTRAKTTVHRLSFVALVIGPILLNIFLMTGTSFSLVAFLCGFSIMYSVYEIGYIYNDVYTTSKENKPTKWLNADREVFARDAFPLLIASRLLSAVVLFILLSRLPVRNLGLFALLIGVMNMVFALHNYYRDWRNVLTDGGLQIIKYLSVLVLFAEGKTLGMYCAFLYFEIAFERTLEFGIGKKYILHYLQAKNIDSLRIGYYIALTVVGIGLILIDSNYYGLTIGSSYLLVYRILCKVLLNNRNVVNSRNKQ